MPGQSRFLFSKDSNTVYFATMMRAIYKVRPDWAVNVFVPLPEQVISDKGERYAKTEAIERLKEDMRGVGNIPNLHLMPYKYVSEAFTQRFNFNVRGFMPYIKSLCNEYDFVWCNEPAHVQNWTVTMFGRRMSDAIPIGSLCHWVTGWTGRKAPSDRLDWMIRHAEGAYSSVFTLLSSKTAAALFIEGARQYFNRSFLEKITPKIGTLAVPTDSSNFMAKKSLGERKTDGPLRLLWAHRLNSYTGFEHCFQSLKILHDKRPGTFTLWVPDPGDRDTQENLHDKYPFIEMLDKKTWSFDQYVKLCWSAHVVLGNHQALSVWGGLALSEPQICGCFALTPDTSWYREQVGPADEMGINFFKWKSQEALANAVERIVDAPREWVIAQGEKQAKYALESFDMDVYANRLVSFIESVTYPRRDEKWVKYIQDAARAGHLNSDNGLSLGELYRRMAEWGKMGNLKDPETGKSNGWPTEKKNFWCCIRRRLLDSEILTDDPTDPVCRYRIGPKVNDDVPAWPGTEEDPVWKIAANSPWLHRDVDKVETGLKDQDGNVHPMYSLLTEDSIENNTFDEADIPEAVEDEDLTSVIMERGKNIPVEKKKRKKKEEKVEEPEEDAEEETDKSSLEQVKIVGQSANVTIADDAPQDVPVETEKTKVAEETKEERQAVEVPVIIRRAAVITEEKPKRTPVI
jgi:glycosyltransferase involved in cell wall biosynthesis